MLPFKYMQGRGEKSTKIFFYLWVFTLFPFIFVSLFESLLSPIFQIVSIADVLLGCLFFVLLMFMVLIGLLKKKTRREALSYLGKSVVVFTAFFIALIVATDISNKISLLQLASSDITVENIYLQTNTERKTAGLNSLGYDTKLEKAASNKAANMCRDGYWSHANPNGITPWDFIKAQNKKYNVAGENLARDFSSMSDLFQNWMNSPSHRENIVNPEYRRIGIGVADCKTGNAARRIVVQMFSDQ